jgi:hypothetical protein
MPKHEARKLRSRRSAVDDDREPSSVAPQNTGGARINSHRDGTSVRAGKRSLFRFRSIWALLRYCWVDGIGVRWATVVDDVVLGFLCSERPFTIRDAIQLLGSEWPEPRR